MKDEDVHQAVIDSDVSTTGCTIHFVTEEVDQGGVLFKIFFQYYVRNLFKQFIVYSSNITCITYLNNLLYILPILRA